MKENINENEEEEKEKISNLDENINNSIQGEESEEVSESKDSELPMLNSQLGEKQEPKKESLNDIIKSAPTIDSSISYQIVDKYNIILSKNLYISKDFIFIFFLLISPALNFSYLYLPFFILVIFSYFLLYNFSKKNKRLKFIIEIIALVYAFCLLILKIYFIVAIKRGSHFPNIKNILLDLGIFNLIDIYSNYYIMASFLGEIFIIIISIYSIVIVYLIKDVKESEYIDSERKLNEKEFYSLMSKCIFLFYFMVVGWSIFNRSILTLFYLMPMNIIIYILAMNVIQKLLFIIFKFFSIFLTFVIFIHLISINIFNVYSIRTYFLKDVHEIRDNYPRIVNIWTKLGINQAFDSDMRGEKVAEEYFGYFFGSLALLVLIYINKKLTISKFREASHIKNNNDEMQSESDINCWKKFIMKIKTFIYNPSFILHICRISAVLWLVFYQNFYSIGVIIWLFFSFIFLKPISNKYVTVIFLAPMVFVCLFCYHLANIDGIIENKDNKKIYRNFALGKFTRKNIEYILCNIFYFLITLFIYRIFRVETEEKKIDKKKENEDIILSRAEKLKQNLIGNNEDNNDLNVIKEAPKEDEEDINSNLNEKKDNDNLINNENKENQKSEEEKIIELYNKLTIVNILVKALINILDIITLVCLYILSVYSINIAHLIFVIIFMLQLLFPELMMKYSLVFIILTQIFFLIEYCVDLLKTNDYSQHTINLIKLFIPFDLNEISIDFLLYIVTYCFYFQYHSKNYNIVDNINMEMYIQVIFYNYPRFQKVLFFIGKIIEEIYIWTLIVFFIIFNGLFEISILFAISLLIFLIIVFKYVKKIQKKSEISNYILIIFCVLNTLSVFVFQILCLDIFNFNEKIINSNNFFIKNLPAIGFYRYFNNKLLLKFLPHFISNLISKLLLNEMKNIEDNEATDEKTDKKTDIKTDEQKDTIKKLIEYKLLLDSEKNLGDENKKKLEEQKSNLIYMHSSSSSISLTKKKSSQEIQQKKSSSEISFQSLESEDISESEKNKLLEQYNENKNKMSLLDIKNFSYNIILVITKFYWIFLFLFICIISTTYDLSILSLIYIIIFGIIFIQMFYYIINRLSAYTEKSNKPKNNNKRENINNDNNSENDNKEIKYPFFISKLIRYNLIEKVRHINDNKKFRTLGFKYLIVFNFLSYFLFYLDGIFNIFQHGCKSVVYDDCDINHYKIIDKEGFFANVSENLIVSISYIIGFNANLKNGTVLYHAWFHILFGALLCLDSYIQKLEDHFNELSKLNRKEYRRLVNENLVLKSEINEQQKKEEKEEEIKEEKKELPQEIKEEEKKKEKEKPKLFHKGTILLDINALQKKEAGQNLINQLKEIFENISKTIKLNRKVELSSSNDKMKIIIIVKNIFEEVIIFFLIVTAIAKLNIWSLIYIIYAIYLILTKKNIKKYYVLYCFVISSIMIQLSLFVSNLQKNTDPNPDLDDIEIMKETFNLPWYKNCGMSDEHAFFFGLGACHSQINLIWMDFIQVVVIYIYLDFFSYSIYQEGKTIGKSESSINYFNLHLNSEIKKVTKKLSQEEYDKHFDCMKYNFGVEKEPKVDTLYKFKYYIEHGKEDNNNKIIGEKEEEEEHNIILNQKEEKKQENLEEASNIKAKEENKCMNIVRKFFYLSFHNVILILIITISMLISGFISIIYIIISLCFLLTSTRIYLGKHYLYPRLIKKFLRIMLLIDILLQIFYQIPYINSKKQSDEEGIVYVILGYIGLNKMLVFGKDEKENFIVIIGWAEMSLVLTKVLLFFLISIQIFIYSSQSFLEFYFGYILTKNSYLHRVSLMKVFKFNNKRIEVMNRNINLRKEMPKKMRKLEQTLEEWKQNILQKYKEETQDNNIDNNIDNDNIDNNIDNDLNKERSNILKVKNSKSVGSDEPKKEKLKLTNISKSVGLPKKKKDESKILSNEEVIQRVKSWVINGFLAKVQISFHKFAENYNNISEKEKYIYERDMIQGKTKANTIIEDIIELDLKEIFDDNSDIKYTENEMEALKKYFDGTRQKRLEKIKQKKEKLKKLSNVSQKIININKLKNLVIKDKEKKDSEKKEIKKFKEIISKERKDFYKKKEKELSNKHLINRNLPKFSKFIKISQKNNFSEYLTKSYLITSILKDFFSLLSNNFHWLCYFIMILNHIMSNSIISLFYPISIFCYAIMEYPRPRKKYWHICFIYTIIFLVIKFIIHLQIWQRISSYKKGIKVLENYRLGFKLYDSTFSKGFFVYILFDALVLIFLLINNYLLVFSGLYEQREQEIENIYQANERIAKTKNKELKTVEEIKKFNEEYISEIERKIEEKKKREELSEEESDILSEFSDMEETREETSNNYKEIDNLKQSGYFKHIKEKEKKKLKEQKKLFDESSRTYFESLFPKIRNEKPGNEFYVYYTIGMTFIILYIFLLYTIMIKDKTFGPVNFKTKQFSGEMVCFLLVHIIILLVDRVIYIRQNRNHLKYEYMLYNNKIGKLISNISDIPNIDIYPNFTKNENSLLNKCTANKKYNIIYIQRETFNTPLLEKYILQIVIVIFGHLFIFFFMPMYGNYKLNRTVYCKEQDKECNDFLKNVSLPIFYIFYLFYFITSGLQVKYGFYDMKKKSVLKSKNNTFYGMLYSGYKNVPFLYEIKLGIDWTFTATGLDLFQWNKFESIYDIIFTTNCSMNSINAKNVGKIVTKKYKVGLGGLCSFGLLLVLVGPLLLFSSLNPTNQLNNLTNSDLTVELSFLFKNKLMKNYTLYQNLKPQSIEPISDDDFENFNYTKGPETKNFPIEQIQTVLFFEENDRNWDLSLPHIKNLIELVQSRNRNISSNDINYVERIDLVMDYTFYRPLPPEAQVAKKRYNRTIFTRGGNITEQDENLDNLGEALEKCEDKNITFKKIFYPPIRLRGTSHPKSMKSKEYFHNLDVQLGFRGCKKFYDETKKLIPSYLESYFTFSLVKSIYNETEGVRFHIFSDKASTTTLNYSAFSFYLAFVLVVGNYVRNFFAGQPEKIILTEMPHNEKIMDLCEGIKIARYSYDFEKEEQLYYNLMEIMRSPEYLMLLTTSSIEQYEDRLKRTKDEEEKEKEQKEKEKNNKDNKDNKNNKDKK